MNLEDLTLLRGWIRHVDWNGLDDPLPEPMISTRKRVKALRRQLAAKARFYSKPDWVKLWSEERLPTPSWERRALYTLAELAKLPEPVPALEHPVERWLPEAVCNALPYNVRTLDAVVDMLEAYFAGNTPLPEALQPMLKDVTAFFDSHVQQLGYQLNKRPKPSALPVPLVQVAPLERVLIPAGLNGAHGSNRAPDPPRIQAGHDLDAINSWLALKDGNPKTHQAYKKELERLLLWAVLERGKAVSDLNTDDCRAYIQFLKGLTIADRQWVALAPANKSYGKWKPFYYRIPKGSTGTPDNPADPAPSVLSPKSINYAKTVISACMDWLVKQHYLKHNNFDTIPAIRFAQTGLQADSRAFTHSQIQQIFAYAQSRLFPDAADFGTNRRTLFILKFAFSTGLRIHELAAASYGDIECMDDGSGCHYFLKVTGKHSKIRKTSLPAAFIDELHSYLRFRRLPANFDFLPHAAPLIPNLRDRSGRKHLSPAGIHNILSAFFAAMSDNLGSASASEPRLADKLRKASTHWLRHSYGSYLANDRQVPLAYIRDELGHANINTTSLYLNTDAKLRQKTVSDAFNGF